MSKKLYLFFLAMTVVLYCECSKDGADKSFLIPEVSTEPIINITARSAICGGNIISDGGTSITSGGICWSTVTNPTISGYKTINSAKTGRFESAMIGITPGTLYYVRAYATNSVGTSYGNELTFVTSSDTNSITDLDGNIYIPVIVGDQIWMRENLKTTRYNTGISIRNETTIGAWYGLRTGAYCNFNNVPSNSDVYGRLYNWFVIDSVCPSGWHVPSRSEWQTLINIVGGENVGGRLKERTTAHWIPENFGAGNYYDFSALPGGYLASYSKTFEELGISGNWWSSTEFSDVGAWFFGLRNYAEAIGSNSDLKTEGLSIRCIKDN